MRTEPSTAARKPAGSLEPFDRARRKFLRKFPGGFRDETYLAWERNYKWEAHEEWMAELNRENLRAQLSAGAHREIAAKAVKIESGRSLLFSFEKMALRDAVRSDAGAKRFQGASLNEEGLGGLPTHHPIMKSMYLRPRLSIR